MRPAESARRTVNPDRGSARPLLKRCEANRPGHHRHQPETSERLEVHEKKTGHQDRGDHTRTGRGARTRTRTGHRAATRRTERRRGRQPTGTARRPRRTRRTNVSARRRPDRTARRRRHRRGVRPDGPHTRARAKVPDCAQGRRIQPRSIDAPGARRAPAPPTGQQRPLTPSGHGHGPARGDCRGQRLRATRATHQAGRSGCRPRGRHRRSGGSGGREDSGDRSPRDRRGRRVVQRLDDDRIRTGLARRRRRNRLHRTRRTMTPTRIRAVTPAGTRAAALAGVRGAALRGGRSRPGTVAGRRGRSLAGLRPRCIARWRCRRSRAGALGRSALALRLAAGARGRPARTRSGLARIRGALRAMTVTARRTRATTGRTRVRLLRRRLVSRCGGSRGRRAVGRGRSRCCRGARGRRGGRRGRTRSGSRRSRGRRTARSRGGRLGARGCGRAGRRGGRRGSGGRSGACRFSAPGPGAARAVGHRETRRDGARRCRDQHSARERTADPRTLSAQSSATVADHGDDPRKLTQAPPIRWQGCLHHGREYASRRREERAPYGPPIDRLAVHRTIRRRSGTVHRSGPSPPLPDGNGDFPGLRRHEMSA